MIVWLGLLAVTAWYLLQPLRSEQLSKTIFLPAPSSHAHHQLDQDCLLCHQPFKGVQQQVCLDCHAKALEKVSDSHAIKIFKDPRNAATLQKIDATRCITCHHGHQYNDYVNDVTLPPDFCRYCHQDIADDRPSHQDMSFDTCTQCHHYHDNTALYEDFLAKHLDETNTQSQATIPQRNLLHFYRKKATHPVEPLRLIEHDAPVQTNLNLAQDWLNSSHARAGVNCQRCHTKKGSAWVDKPDYRYCQQCHKKEVRGFLESKHGMRLKAGLSPMTTDQARLPMRNLQDSKILNCQSCHNAHAFDTSSAGVDACLACHADKHSLAYKQSKHYVLWQAEQKQAGMPGSGVSCASCHLPRLEASKKSKRMKAVQVQHNQSHNLKPNQKMIRQVCMRCHGVGFSLDALADRRLIDNNFSGLPTQHLTTLEMVKNRLKQQ